MSLMNKMDDLANHGLIGGGSNGSGGIGRHMLIYRSHVGNATSTAPTITLRYYQSIFPGEGFYNIKVVDITTGEVVTGKPVIANDDTIELSTSNGKPLLYNGIYQVMIPERALKDKRGIDLIGNYSYNFQVIGENTTVSIISPDMTIEEIQKILDELTDEEGNINNVVISVPAGRLDIGDGLVYPNGLVLVGNNTIIESTSENKEAVLRPAKPGHCKLTMTGFSLPKGSIIGEWLDLTDVSVGFKIIDTADPYELNANASIQIRRCHVGRLTLKNYSNDVYILESAIHSMTLTDDTDYNTIHGNHIYIEDSMFNTNSTWGEPVDSCQYVIEAGSMSVRGTSFTNIGFILDGVEYESEFYNCNITIDTDMDFISRGNHYVNGEEIPYTTSSVKLLASSVIGSEITAVNVISISGESTPDVILLNNTFKDVNEVIGYHKDNLTQYYNSETPVLYFGNNSISTLGKVINADKGCFQRISLMFIGNSVLGNFSLPNNYFKGMINCNIMDTCTVSMTDILTLNDNITMKG